MRSFSSFPKVSLGIFPTPIQRLENISRRLHTNVYIKRDDLSGLGLGGNKVRKLEYLLADAKEKGAKARGDRPGGQPAAGAPDGHGSDFHGYGSLFGDL